MVFRFKDTFLLVALLALSCSAWARFTSGPMTAREYAMEISRIQMETHHNADNLEERFTGIQSIPYVDIVPQGGLDGRILMDPGTSQNTESWIQNLGIVTEVNGQKALRIFFHPYDATYRDMIYEELQENGDVIVGEGKLEAFPSASRSLFVVSGNEILQLKMSTKVVNNVLEEKKFTPSMAFSSVMNSAVVRKHLPGALLEEPLAVKISDHFAYVVRKFADFKPNDRRLWVPGYAFGFSAMESAMFAEYKGKVLRPKVKREWIRLSTRVGVLRQLSNNHLQNLVIALDRNTGEIVESHLLDALDMHITKEDLEEGMRELKITRSAFGEPPTVRTRRFNRLHGWGLADIEVPLAKVGEYFRKDTADIPTPLLGNMIRDLFQRSMFEPLWRNMGWMDPDRARLVGYLTELFALQREGVLEESRRREIIKHIVLNWPGRHDDLFLLWGIEEGSTDRFSQYVREAAQDRWGVLRPTASCSSFVQVPVVMQLAPHF